MKTTIIVDKKNEKVTNQVSVKKADTKNPAGKEKKAEKKFVSDITAILQDFPKW